MRKQKLQFFILLLILALVVFGYLYAQHYSKSHEDVDTSPSFELIEDATTEDTEEPAEESEAAETESSAETATEESTEVSSEADTEVEAVETSE